MSRQRMLLVILLLTFNAGWVNSLAFLSLGRVFASFLSGNFVFIGLSVADGDGALLLRAVVVILSVVVGIVGGAAYLESVGHPREDDDGWKRVDGLLSIEMAVLLAFAATWRAVGDRRDGTAVQLLLLGLAGFAMGIQGIVVARCKVRGAIANALTGTIVLLGTHLAHRFQPRHEASDEVASDSFLATLLLLYATSATAVVLLRTSDLAPFVPAVVALVAMGVAASRRWSTPIRWRRDRIR